LRAPLLNNSHEELVQRIERDLLDSYDEELEQKIEARDPQDSIDGLGRARSCTTTRLG
jgi:hypothetical protein